MPKVSIGDSFSVSLLSGIEKLWIRRGGGVSIFSVEKFCRKVPKTSWRNPSVLCFGQFAAAKKFMDQNAGGENQDFPSKLFCLTLPKNFVQDGGRKSLDKRGRREYQSFPPKIFCLTVPKVSIGESVGSRKFG